MHLLTKSLLLLLAGLVFFVLAGFVSVWAPDQPVEDLIGRWAAPPSQFVLIDGLQVHIRDEGPRADPTPIVLLHGTSDSLHTWDGWADTLKSQRRVIRFDLPGFGLTGPGRDGDYSIARYVRFVSALLDRLQIPVCVLGGNSLGGQIAWATALALPQRVRQLLLVNASGYPVQAQQVPLAFKLIGSGWGRRLLEYLLPRGLVQSSVRSLYGDPAKVTPELVDRYYDMARRAGNRRALANRMDTVPIGDWTRIKTLVLPTLIIWGAEDRLIPVQSGDQFAHDIAGARLVVFEHLGHLPQQEDPLATVAVVQQFLGWKSAN